jgi:secondary thiamine-phosphate synthase enzyme
MEDRMKAMVSYHRPVALFSAFSGEIRLETAGRLHFVDVTDRVEGVVRASGIRTGTANVQSLHTTAAVLVNEHEPLLLQDLCALLERIAPSRRRYRHDDFALRTVNMAEDEKQNGHAHCKSLLLTTSVQINVVEGALKLGRWQRVFLVELDRSRPRRMSVMVCGL